MRDFDFSSWDRVLTTLLGLALVALIGVGVRLVFMQALQQRRERENRQINERLRTLIAAYKTLGGSFTGQLTVDPAHLRDLEPDDARRGFARGRRIRDAVEAALSDVILLGTEAQVRLAAQAAQELVSGKAVHTAELVVSLREFIRQVLDLDPIAVATRIPPQGPARVAAKEGGRDEKAGKGGGTAMAEGLGGGGGLAAPHHDDDEGHHG